MKSLENFIVKLKKDTEKSLAKEEKAKAAKKGTPHNGNSRISSSIKTKVKETSVSMSMFDYWKFVNDGRKPGNVSQAGRENIKSWIKRKGLNPSKIIDEITAKSTGHMPKKRTSFLKAVDQLSFLVSRKIKIKGYEGNSFYDKVINDGRLEELYKDVGKEVKITVVDTFNGKTGK